MRVSSQRCNSEVGEAVVFHRWHELPTVELCCISGSSRRWGRFCTGLEVVASQTWEGDILYRRRRHRLAPGMVLVAEPGFVLRFVEVRRVGDLRILTIDSAALIRPLVSRLPVMGSPFELSSASGSAVAPWLTQLQSRDVCFGALLASLRRLVEQAPADSAAPLPKVEVDSSPGSKMSRRGFSAHHGLPPHAYDLCRRIALAQQALRMGRTDLTKLAVDHGFVDQSHFIRHFKRLVGVTPSQYRNGAK